MEVEVVIMPENDVEEMQNNEDESTHREMDTHQESQEGERPHQCKDCGKAFTGASHLRTHQRTHTRKRVYECKDWSKILAGARLLLTHQRTHTGERPHECKD